jgi:hypothetical protein
VARAAGRRRVAHLSRSREEACYAAPVRAPGDKPPPSDVESPTTVEAPGWRRVSVNAPVFAQLAQDLAAKLEARGTGEALALARQGRALMAALQGWQTAPPVDGERSRVMNDLVEFNRAASDLLDA